MKFLRIAAVALVFSWFINDATAQIRTKNFFIGVGLGATNYLGDLDDNLSPKFTRPGFAVMGGYKFHPHMSVRLTFAQGWISAKDQVGAAAPTDPRWRRNLSFRSPLSEMAATLHYEFFGNSRRFTYRPKWSPNIFAGVGVFYFNPRAQIGGEWFNLQPLGTEGQFLPGAGTIYPTPYKLVQIAIPFGVGVRYRLTDKLDIHLEMGFRKIFTDYLDDVSDVYPNIDDLAAQNPVAAQLSDRIDRSVYPEGAAFHNGIRGHAGFGNQDWYVLTMVSATYILDWVKCPKFR